MEGFIETEQERKVWTFHTQGFAPSEIDSKMSLDKGTAHDIIVGLWKRQKDASKHDLLRW